MMLFAVLHRISSRPYLRVFLGDQEGGCANLRIKYGVSFVKFAFGAISTMIQECYISYKIREQVV